MPRRKTKPEDIRDPERYFNRYIAGEVRHDREKAAEIRATECSLEEKLEGGTPEELIINRHGKMFETASDFLDTIENERLLAALLTLSETQLELVKLLFEKRATQREAAAALGVSQFSVHSRMRTIIAKLKKYLKNY